MEGKYDCVYKRRERREGERGGRESHYIRNLITALLFQQADR